MLEIEILGDSEILEAMEEMDLSHRHEDASGSLDDMCWGYFDESILLEHNTDINSMIEKTLNGKTFPSEDIWNKFELFEHISDDELITSSSDESDVLIQKLSSSLESLSSSPREIRHHDCMWSGNCSNDQHELLLDDIKPPVLVKPINSRSLLNPKIVLQNKKMCCPYSDTKRVLQKIIRERAMKFSLDLSEAESEQRPDTPVSDFEDTIFQTDIKGYESDSRSDTECRIKKDAFTNDHSYHIVRAASSTKLQTESLGVQTPSDSEEEIDVVSLGCPTTPASPIFDLKVKTKSPSIPITRSTRVSSNLPTNPSPSDQTSLQNHLTEAITAKRQPSTRISVPPLRIRLDATPSKKRSAAVSVAASHSSDADDSSSNESQSSTSKRGVKRGKHRRSAASYAAAAEAASSPRKRGSRSSSDSEDSGKRTMHNTMERQRRVDLRNAFEGLRVLIPKLSEQEKAPKVHILKEAGLYCRHLQITDNALLRKQADLKKRQTLLRERVSSLRRSLAAYR